MYENEIWPIVTKQAATYINNIHTEIFLTAFTDKIMVVISQFGVIGNLVHAKLESRPYESFQERNSSCRILLGETSGEVAELSILYADSILRAIEKGNPRESRPLLLGISLKHVEDKEEKMSTYYKIYELMLENKVW